MLEQQHVSRKLNFDSTGDIRHNLSLLYQVVTHVSVVMHGLSVISEYARTTACVEETEL